MKNIFSTLAMLSCSLVLNSCSVEEVSCPAFDSANAMMNYVQVMEDVASVTYASDSDSLFFMKHYFGFSEAYVERCGGFADPYCGCFNVFESTYRADSLFLDNDVIVRISDDESVETVDVSYQSNGFRWNSARVENTPTSIHKYFKQLEMPEIELNGRIYYNILELPNMRGSDSIVSKMYIQENNGLVGFVFGERTYTLVEK